jgi:hypothetical protein
VAYGNRDSVSTFVSRPNLLAKAEQISLTGIASGEAVARRSTRRLSQIAKGRKTRCSKHAHARIAKGGGFIRFPAGEADILRKPKGYAK